MRNGSDEKMAMPGPRGFADQQALCAMKCDTHLRIAVRFHRLEDSASRVGPAMPDRRGMQVAALCCLLASDAFDGFSVVDQLGEGILPSVHASFVVMTWPLLLLTVVVSLATGGWAARELRGISSDMPLLGSARHFLRFGVFGTAALGCLVAHVMI